MHGVRGTAVVPIRSWVRRWSTVTPKPGISPLPKIPFEGSNRKGQALPDHSALPPLAVGKSLSGLPVPSHAP